METEKKENAQSISVEDIKNMNIYEKKARVMGAMEVNKDKTCKSTNFSFSYRNLDDILHALTPLLEEYRLFYNIIDAEYININGETTIRQKALCVNLDNPSEQIETTMQTAITRASRMQEIGSINTYIQRYMYVKDWAIKGAETDIEKLASIEVANLMERVIRTNTSKDLRNIVNQDYKNAKHWRDDSTQQIGRLIMDKISLLQQLESLRSTQNLQPNNKSTAITTEANRQKEELFN